MSSDNNISTNIELLSLFILLGTDFKIIKYMSISEIITCIYRKGRIETQIASLTSDLIICT